MPGIVLVSSTEKLRFTRFSSPAKEEKGPEDNIKIKEVFGQKPI